jgi:hypothetical protein
MGLVEKANTDKPILRFAVLGTVMIGMSIWQSIQIEGPGFRARLAELEAQLRGATVELNQAVNSVNSAKEHIEAQNSLAQISRVPAQPRLDLSSWQSDYMGNGLSQPRDQTIMSGIIAQQKLSKALHNNGYSAYEVNRITEIFKCSQIGGGACTIDPDQILEPQNAERKGKP